MDPLEKFNNILDLNEKENLDTNEDSYDNVPKIIKSSKIEDYSKFLSKRNLTPVQLTPIEMNTFFITNGIYQFGAGVPSQLFFPIKGLKLQFQFVDELVEIENDNLDIIQQYSQLPGLPKLVEWLRNLQQRYHGLENYKTKYKEWDICLTTGSQQGLDATFRVLFDRNDSIISERYSYGGMFALTQPSGINAVGVEMDDKGMIPEKLRNTLKNWNILYKDKKFPKAIYVIPHGQNPTGVIYDQKRKLEIYEICSEFNLLIIEDDPHFFLQFDVPIDSKGNRILEQSFLKIDKDDRVIRLDTFSKFLSSGIRMGIVTCNKKLLELIEMEVNCAIYHPSNLTQCVLESLFLKWGNDGFDYHVKRVQEILIKKRDETIQVIERHLKDLVSYRIPNSGLYFWLKLHNVECSYTFIKDIVFPKKVLFGLGISHSPDRTVKSPFIRITFSYLTKEDAEIAFKILADCLISNNKNINNNSKNHIIH